MAHPAWIPTNKERSDRFHCQVAGRLYRLKRVSSNSTDGATMRSRRPDYGQTGICFTAINWVGRTWPSLRLRAGTAYRSRIMDPARAPEQSVTGRLRATLQRNQCKNRRILHQRQKNYSSKKQIMNYRNMCAPGTCAIPTSR